MDNELMAKRLEGIDSLPALPLVLRQIQKVMKNENANMAQIAMVVAKDQALASRAIRLVNSAWYGRTIRVTSIQQAIMTLGLKTLNTLMLGLSVIKMFDSSRSQGFDAHAFWEHSFGTALLSRKLAVQVKKEADADEYFVAGLMHDMGRLVMEQYLNAEYTAALQKMRDNGKTLLACEREVFGFDHAETGAWLGGRWEIPAQLVVSMKYHHAGIVPDEVSISEKLLLQTVATANELCVMGNIGSSGERPGSSGFGLPTLVLSNDIKSRMIEEARKDVAGVILEWGRE